MSGLRPRGHDRPSHQVKGSRCAMSRWFDLVDISAKDQPYTKLVGLLYYGIQTGDLRSSSFESLMAGKLKHTDLQQEDDKVEVSKSNEPCRKLREACKNSSVFATICYCDPMHHVKTNLLVVCTAPLRRWHAEQSMKNRSCADSVEWYLDLASGSMMTPLCDTAQLMFDEEAMDTFGLQVSFSKVDARLDDEDPRLVGDNSKANLMAQFIFGLVKQRILKTMWCTHGWPGRLSLMSRPEFVEGLVAELKRDYELFKEISGMKSPFIKRMAKRSVFNTIVVEQAVAMLEDDGWRASEKFVLHCKAQWSIVGASKATEDIFQRYRWL